MLWMGGGSGILLRMREEWENVADVNDKLQDLNKKQKQLNDEEKPQVENQQNNYYLGSTSDIQKMLREDNVIDVEAERVISREP